MINFSCIQDLIDIANAQERTIDDIVVEYEATHSFKSVIYIKENMQTIKKGGRILATLFL